MNITNKGILLIVSGPAGSGKGTVVNTIVNSSPEYALSVSDTTRSPRFNETNGVHYNFVTKEQFEDNIKNGRMLEYCEYCGNYYGTPRSKIEELLEQGINVILEIEVVGAMKVKKAFPDAVTIALYPPSKSILESRLRGRGTNTECDIINRLRRAKEELELMPDYDYIVINGDGMIDSCAKQIMDIVKTAKHETKRNLHMLEDFYK